MKLKLSSVNTLFFACVALAGRTRVIESEGKAVNATTQSFDFPQQTKVNIIRNTSILTPHREAYVEAQKAIVAKLSPDGTAKTIDDSPVLLAKYQEQHKELLESKVEVRGLLLINWADLEVAKVDTGTIGNLGILVRGLPKADDADLVPDPEADAKPAV